MNFSPHPRSVFAILSSGGLLTLLALLSVCVLFPVTACADDLDDALFAERSVSVDIPELPGPEERDREFVIGPENLEPFTSVLLAPLAGWIRDGNLYFRAVKKLPEAWEYSRSWRLNTKRNVGLYELDAFGSIQGERAYRWPGGFPFGSSGALNQLSDSEDKAKKILWNCSFAIATSSDVFSSFEMLWVGTRALVRRASGVYYRKYIAGGKHRAADLQTPQVEADEVANEAAPGTETPPTTLVTTAQPHPALPPILFRELFQLYDPAIVLGYARIAERFSGPEEDSVWLHSPVTGKTRHLFNANRSDNILGGALVQDDLFVSSEKIQLLNASVVDQKVVLVPFPELSSRQLSTEFVRQDALAVLTNTQGKKTFLVDDTEREHFEEVPTVRGAFERRDLKNIAVGWNFETRRFPNAAAWVPTTVTFVPRKVWVLELTTKDPFYQFGREVLVVDQEMMLPVYKIVFDQKGEYLRTVVGGWIRVRDEKDEVIFPMLGFVLAVEKGGKRATALAAEYNRTFLGADSKLTQALEPYFGKEVYHANWHGEEESAALEEDEVAASDSTRPEDQGVETDADTDSETADADDEAIVPPADDVLPPAKRPEPSADPLPKREGAQPLAPSAEF